MGRCRCLIFLALVTAAKGFSVQQPRQAVVEKAGGPELSRAEFARRSILAIGGGIFWTGSGVGAEEILEEVPPSPPPPSFTISECKVPGGGKPANCISTASVRLVDCYAPPWTFQGSADEAMARLKGVVATDPALELVSEEGGRYLKIKTTRKLATDIIEFVVNDKDQVVTFRSAEDTDVPSLSDFGANRKRLEEIRKKAEIFGVMGEGLTADSYEGGRGNGPLQQLKAFYGLQSGEGFEEVFMD